MKILTSIFTLLPLLSLSRPSLFAQTCQAYTEVVTAKVTSSCSGATTKSKHITMVREGSMMVVPARVFAAERQATTRVAPTDVPISCGLI